ncbi:putative repeat protein (TIGR03943 family) [Actinoplanes tereljensis]|uniref:Membrane protein n=1 Tax=Paractinoplanes tereljensis TaxID=571912 RepID=A0A919TZ53_9ACTN|nr:TIGR03943 family protein [Actinoplanes tereljensis]GIF26839.1 membrane protein [Actinoplanes tereljensis]
MNRRIQGILLLLLGGAVVKISINGTYLRYVKAGLRPLLIVAGVLLIAVAVVTLWQELRPHAHAEHDDDDGHGHHQSRIGWLLLLPALGLLLVSPKPLSSFAAAKSGTVTVSAQSDYPPLPAGDPAPLPLLQYAARALLDGGRSLTGRTVQLTGFITGGPDGKPALARIVLNCCAADGRPIKVALTGAPPTGLADGTWVQAVGRYSTQVGKDPLNDAAIAYLEVASWQEIPAPEQPYE